MVSLISSNQNINLPIELSEKYDPGDYENLRRNHVFDWNSISDTNVDKYADNLNENINRGKDSIVKQDSQARNNIGQDFSHLEMK